MIKYCSLNCRGLNEGDKRAAVFSHLRHPSSTSSYDFIFLQETHCPSPSKASEWTKQWGGDALFTSFSSSSAGVAILFRRHLTISIISSFLDPSGRYISIFLSFSPSSLPSPILLHLVCIYAPNDPEERAQFFSGLIEKLPTLHSFPQDQEVYSFIAGDFNCVDDPKLDKVGGDPSSGIAGSAELGFLIGSWDCVDAWRYLNPSAVATTWRNKLVGTRIDRIYVPRSLLPSLSLSSTQVVGVQGLDHDLVQVEMEFFRINRGPGYWKLNTSLLTNPSYMAQIRNVIEAWSIFPHPDPLVAWDSLKSKVRKESIKFAKAVAALHRSRDQAAQSRFDDALTSWTSFPSPESAAALSLAKEELVDRRSRRLVGAQIRSRAKWLEEGEKPTSYFCRLEKVHASSNSINALLDENGNLVHSPNGMSDIAGCFYRKLYTPEAEPDPVALDSILAHLPHLPSSDSDSLESPWTLEELTLAMKLTPRGRTPGLDGLPIEFYAAFWDLLCAPLLEVFEFALSSDSPLPYSWLISGIILLFKKENPSVSPTTDHCR